MFMRQCQTVIQKVRRQNRIQKFEQSRNLGKNVRDRQHQNFQLLKKCRLLALRSKFNSDQRVEWLNLCQSLVISQMKKMNRQFKVAWNVSLIDLSYMWESYCKYIDRSLIFINIKY